MMLCSIARSSFIEEEKEKRRLKVEDMVRWCYGGYESFGRPPERKQGSETSGKGK